jgi:peptidoglycan hydrolase-like protein with peptidoglycan-binding domain
MVAIAETQDCLGELGYYDGLVDGEAGEATHAAFARFAEEHGLVPQLPMLSPPAQALLGALCGSKTAALPKQRFESPVPDLPRR